MASTPSRRFHGTLKKWNAERGFGFVSAHGSDQELFVHASAFPRDGRPPEVGETLSFEVEPDREGRKRAVRVRCGDIERRVTPAAQPRPARSRAPASTSSLPWGSWLIAMLLLGVLGWFGHGWYQKQVAAPVAAEQPVQSLPFATDLPSAPAPRFQCDGRQHCSQMTSCQEAKFFLKNCPDTKMDGDGDGVPCEQQWCTGLFGGG